MSTNIKVIQFNSPFTNKKVEIKLDPLPHYVDVIEILVNEKAYLYYWIKIAKVYYNYGYHEIFGEILEKSREKANLNYDKSDSDKMILLDSLAAHYVNLSKKEFDKDARRDLITRATRLYTAADKIEMLDENHLVGRAFHCLLENDKIDQAETHFNFVLDKNPNNVIALLGKARINYIRNDIKLSLSYYRKVLELFPYGISGVRVGIGLCMYKLNKIDLAEKSFKRALELDENCIGAMVGLGIIKLNSKVNNEIKIGMDYISNAYNLNPNNALILNLLADHFFHKNDYSRSEKLIKTALQRTSNENILSYSLYQLGRIHHIKNEYENAFKLYLKSVQMYNKLILPYYGLGQLYLYKNEIDNAIKCFERILSVYPNNVECMKILCICYLKYDKNEYMYEKAREYYNKIVISDPDDDESWLGLAESCQCNDINNSLKAYISAVNILNKKNLYVSPEIYNNIGSLYFRNNNYLDALENFEKALEIIDQYSVFANSLPSIVATIKYNIAHTKEALNLKEDAIVLHKEILNNFPYYISSYIRIGFIYKSFGNIDKALEWLTKALELDPDNTEILLNIANLNFSKQEYVTAQRKYEKVMLFNQNKIDCYSCICIANIFLSLINMNMRDIDKKQKLSEKCLKMYRTVLKCDPYNIWAANGIGCILAYNGYISMARDVFSQCRESTADMMDVWINLGHIYYDNKQYTNAIKMYEGCYEKFCGLVPNIELLLYISRAYFKLDQLMKAKSILLKILLYTRNDIITLFNLSLILQRNAEQILKNIKIDPLIINNIILELELSESIFNFLINSEQLKIDRHACEIEKNLSSDLLVQAKQIICRVRQKKEEEDDIIRVHKAKLAEIAKIQEKEYKEELLEKQRKEEEIQFKRLEYLKNTQNFFIPINIDESKQKKKRTKIDDDENKKSKKKSKDIHGRVDLDDNI